MICIKIHTSVKRSVQNVLYLSTLNKRLRVLGQVKTVKLLNMVYPTTLYDRTHVYRVLIKGGQKEILHLQLQHFCILDIYTYSESIIIITFPPCWTIRFI